MIPLALLSGHQLIGCWIQVQRSWNMRVENCYPPLHYLDKGLIRFIFIVLRGCGESAWMGSSDCSMNCSYAVAGIEGWIYGEADDFIDFSDSTSTILIIIIAIIVNIILNTNVVIRIIQIRMKLIWFSQLYCWWCNEKLWTSCWRWLRSAGNLCEKIDQMQDECEYQKNISASQNIQHYSGM